jgi:hypothetical protein
LELAKSLLLGLGPPIHCTTENKEDLTSQSKEKYWFVAVAFLLFAFFCVVLVWAGQPGGRGVVGGSQNETAQGFLDVCATNQAPEHDN